MEWLLYLSAFLSTIYSIIIYNRIYSEVKLIDYCEYSSKPLIYGEDFCENIFEGRAVVTQDYYQNFINTVSSKTLFRGTYNNLSVIFKTTTSNSNFRNVEKQFFESFKSVLNDLGNNLLFIKSEIRSIINFPSTPISKLIFCPDNGNIDNLLRRIPDYSHFTIDNYLELWTILKCNPEPLILKILDPKIWPVPHYYGSCGRLIVVEDCGRTLSDHYYDDWEMRAKIVYQLLENAFKLTFQDPEFAFYLININRHNIAITQEGIVKYIDLEHLIVVSKNSDVFDGFSNHSNKHYDCSICLVVEIDEICSHRISDYNIYAICEEILSDSLSFPGGFLHSMNLSNILILNQLVEECLQPKLSSRFEIAEKMMSLLKEYN